MTLSRRGAPPESGSMVVYQPSTINQGCHTRRRGTGEPTQVIATLEQRDDAALRVLDGDAAHELREIGKIGIGEEEIAERIARPRVEPGGDEHEFGTEFLHCGQKLLLKGGEDLRAP